MIVKLFFPKFFGKPGKGTLDKIAFIADLSRILEPEDLTIFISLTFPSFKIWNWIITFPSIPFFLAINGYFTFFFIILFISNRYENKIFFEFLFAVLLFAVLLLFPICLFLDDLDIFVFLDDG